MSSIAGRPEDRGAQAVALPLTDGDRQGDPGAAILRCVAQHGASVALCGSLDERHAQAQAVPGIFDGRLPLIAGEDGGQHRSIDALAVIADGQYEQILPPGQTGFDLAVTAGVLCGVGEDVQDGALQLLGIGQSVNGLPEGRIAQLHTGPLQQSGGFPEDLPRWRWRYPLSP